MTRIANDITELIGNTPIIRLNRITRDVGAEVLLKLESFNPCASVKDRIALGMIAAAKRDGMITPDTVLVEPTSGNTGIGLVRRQPPRGARDRKPPRKRRESHRHRGAGHGRALSQYMAVRGVSDR